MATAATFYEKWKAQENENTNAPDRARLWCGPDDVGDGRLFVAGPEGI
jgi:hypothetical protein